MESKSVRIRLKFEDFNNNDSIWLLINEKIKTIKDLKLDLIKRFDIKIAFNLYLDNYLINESENVFVLRDNELIIAKKLRPKVSETPLLSTHSLESNFMTSFNIRLKTEKTCDPSVESESNVKSINNSVEEMGLKSKKSSKTKAKENKLTTNKSRSQPNLTSIIKKESNGIDVSQPSVLLDRVPQDIDLFTTPKRRIGLRSLFSSKRSNDSTIKRRKSEPKSLND
jgi:hypothetical protein